MPLRFPTLCAVAALAAGLSACAGTSEPARTAAANQPANTRTAEALARIAHQSLEAGDPVSAVSMLKRAHEIDPSSPAILAELGRNLGALDARTEAADAYRKAAALAPKDAAIRRGYAGALLALDQPVLAEREYRAAIAAREDAATLCGLGVTLDLQDRHDEAEAAFRKAYQLDPQSAATRANLALSLALWGSSDEAIGLLAPMAAAPDAAAKQRQNLALVFGLAGETDQAAAVARIDLGDEAVRSNLAYYETLRALPPVMRMRAIMGARDAQPPLPPRKPELASMEAPAATTAPVTAPPAVTPRQPKRTPAKPSRSAERAAPVAAKADAEPLASRIPVPAGKAATNAPAKEAAAPVEIGAAAAAVNAPIVAATPASDSTTADQPTATASPAGSTSDASSAEPVAAADESAAAPSVDAAATSAPATTEEPAVPASSAIGVPAMEPAPAAEDDAPASSVESVVATTPAVEPAATGERAQVEDERTPMPAVATTAVATVTGTAAGHVDQLPEAIPVAAQPAPARAVPEIAKTPTPLLPRSEGAPPEPAVAEPGRGSDPVVVPASAPAAMQSGAAP